MKKVKQLVRKYQTVSQKVIARLHEKTLEVKSNELKHTKEELQLAKSRIQELEMAGNEVSNQKEMFESFDNKEVVEKSELLEPSKCSIKGNAEEKISVNKSKRKQTLQEKFVNEEILNEENINKEATKKSSSKKGDLKNLKKRKQTLQENELEESKRPRKRTKWTCDNCKKQYSKSSNLHRHIASVHAGLKPFSCPSCEYKCDSKTGLKTHIAGVHDGLKPFKCQTCDSNFASKRCLQKHISNIHDGEKPFKCELCEYTCAAKYTLDVHMKSTHGNNIITCSKCDREFTHKLAKKKHEANCNGTQL